MLTSYTYEIQVFPDDIGDQTAYRVTVRWREGDQDQVLDMEGIVVYCQ